ncbi:MAG: NDP-sugar synthase [Nitrospinae bacterium]|nr:NDP-sugar synthase [Nitrospinota bacterium]
MMRAFVMAAGYGKRLGALGEEIPKPLLPLGGVPLIGFALEKLAAVGVSEVAVNLHHGAEKICSALGDYAHGVHVHYFHEHEILGTAGGIKNAEAFLCEKNEPFFVINADAPCGANLKTALDHHQKGGFLATLILRRSPEAQQYGVLEFDEEGRLRKFLGESAPGSPRGESSQAMFTGLSVMSPEMLSHIPAGKESDISTQIYPSLMESDARIGAILSDSYWMDVGTSTRYLQANMDVMSGEFAPDFNWPPSELLLIEGPAMKWGEGSIEPPVLVGSDVVIQKNAKAGPFTVIMAGATLGYNAVARESIVFPGGKIDENSILERCIVGPEALASYCGGEVREMVFLRDREHSEICDA